MSDIDRAFNDFMGLATPAIQRNTVEWFAAKFNFTAGVTMAIGTPETKKNLRMAERALEESRLRLYFANLQQRWVDELPPEHVLVGPDGERLLTEAGVVHLFTFAETADPQNAPEYRRTRHAILAVMQNVKTL